MDVGSSLEKKRDAQLHVLSQKHWTTVQSHLVGIMSGLGDTVV